MKITRNGSEYELTPAEMRVVYEKMKEEDLREDIQSRADEMEINLSETSMKCVVNEVDDCLSNNDSYWESYWMTIDYVLEEQGEN